MFARSFDVSSAYVVVNYASLMLFLIYIDYLYVFDFVIGVMCGVLCVYMCLCVMCVIVVCIVL